MSPLSTIKRPGGELSNRPLYFFWICDCSGSMSLDGKIQSLNFAIREAIPAMRDAANGNPNAQILVRALKFSSGAQWQIAEPTPVEDFEWTDLTADGVTDLGKALSMVAEQLKSPPMPVRALCPVLILITDGHPTDDYKRGLEELLNLPWGKKAVRIAISVGGDTDIEVLQKFIAHPEFKPLQADNSNQLVERIQWASTTGIKVASLPPSQTKPDNVNDNGLGSVYIPIPQPISQTVIDGDNISW